MALSAWKVSEYLQICIELAHAGETWPSCPTLEMYAWIISDYPKMDQEIFLVVLPAVNVLLSSLLCRFSFLTWQLCGAELIDTRWSSPPFKQSLNFVFLKSSKSFHWFLIRAQTLHSLALQPDVPGHPAPRLSPITPAHSYSSTFWFPSNTKLPPSPWSSPNDYPLLLRS